MNLCYECDITEKIEYCCQRNPETLEQELVDLDDGTQVYACPSFGREGMCMDYDNRPEICSEYQCNKFYETDLVSLLGFDD